MKEIKVTVNTWYVVEGAAGATVINPLTNRAIATVEDGKQASFLATTPYVVASDDSVSVFKAPFNSAPAKLKLLGLLGGGVLPAGYTLLEYIEQPPTTATLNYINAYIATDVQLSDDMVISVDFTPVALAYNGKELYILGAANDGKIVNESKIFGERIDSNIATYQAWGGVVYNNKSSVFRLETNSRYNLEVSKGRVIIGEKESLMDVNTSISSTGTVVLGSWRTAYGSRSKIHGATISKGGKLVASYVPALDEAGAPCLYDTIGKKPFYNGAANEFIVGMNMKQARKLSKLPAGGGSLAVSLPSNYLEDEGVVNALVTAQENGWVITIQTYEAETGAASTFSLRRIWVRKTLDEQGSYVDTDGFRWQVEWCVDIVGADPEQEGYEPFRSVEAATEYWGLEPWVDPAWQDELLTETN